MKKLTKGTKPKRLTLGQIWKLYLECGDVPVPTPDLVGGVLKYYYDDLDGERAIKYKLTQDGIHLYKEFVAVIGSINGNK